MRKKIQNKHYNYASVYFYSSENTSSEMKGIKLKTWTCSTWNKWSALNKYFQWEGVSSAGYIVNHSTSEWNWVKLTYLSPLTHSNVVTYYDFRMHDNYKNDDMFLECYRGSSRNKDHVNMSEKVYSNLEYNFFSQVDFFWFCMWMLICCRYDYSCKVNNTLHHTLVFW